VSYSGPTALPERKLGNVVIKVNLFQSITVVSTSGGVFSSVFNLALSSFDSTEVSGYSTYDEYRILAVDYKFVPISYHASLPSATHAVFVIALDRDSNVALTSLSQGWKYGAMSIASTSEKAKLRYLMRSTDEANFLPLSTSSTGSFKMYSSGMTASTVYGYIMILGLVELRGQVE